MMWVEALFPHKLEVPYLENNMIKLSAISPRTDSLMVNQGSNSPETLQFEQLFSEKAHAVLGAKSPDLANSIAHFKTLESSLETNTASGVFVCDLGGLEIHVPVLLAGGKVKSPEVFFDPIGGSFLPLSSKFLKKVQAGASPQMGSIDPTIKLQDLGTPDIGGITSPPTVAGKFASFSLPILLSRLPNKSKEAFRGLVKKSSVLLKAGVKYHGRDFIDSLADQQEKVAEVTYKDIGYAVLTPSDSADRFSEVFGSRSKLAFREALSSGYVGIDFRKDAAEVVTSVETPIRVTSPNSSGVYKLLRRDRKFVKSLVIKNPINIGDRTGYKYLCILENGDYLLSDDVSAVETSEEFADSSILSKRLGAPSSLRSGTCTFIKSDGDVVSGATIPEDLSGISSSSSDRVSAKLDDYGYTVIFLSDNGSARKPYVPKGENTVFVPANYKPLYLRNRVSESDFMSEPDSVRKLVSEGVNKVASAGIKVIKNSVGDFSLNNKYVGSESDLVLKLASMGASIKSASNFASSIVPGVSHTAHLVKRSNLLKLSSIFGPAPQAPMDPAMYQAGMEAPMPAGMGMPAPQQQMADPSMMAGPEGIPVEQQMMMEQAATLNDQKILDASIASVLLEEAGLSQLTSEYLPKLLEALDSLGRILLTVQMKDAEISEQVGPDEYNKLEKSISKVFSGLGDIVLRLEEAQKIPDAGADFYGAQGF